MPNALAHLGVGGVVTRSLIRDADPKWIYAGCVIPDVPWILQRIAHVLPLEVDPYDLRLYFITQSSLFFCIVLAVALAGIAQAPKRVLAILALNSTLHLLLDACQTKWASGVHFWAPLSWQTWSFPLFWPESATSCILTVFGLVYVVVVWKRGCAVPIDLSFHPYRKVAIAASLFGVYVLAPFFLLSGPEQADSHFIRTLRVIGDRTGRYVELDRSRYARHGTDDVVTVFGGEEFSVTGVTQGRSGSVSVRGVFLDKNTVRIDELHQHWSSIRDYASLVGLGIVGLYWLGSCLRLSRGHRTAHVVDER